MNIPAFWQKMFWTALCIPLFWSPASGQELPWNITMLDGSCVPSVYLVRRIGDRVYFGGERRFAVPLDSLAVMEWHRAGQSAVPTLAGVIAGGIVGGVLGRDDRSIWPLALGCGLGGLAGGILGSVNAAKTTVTDMRTWDMPQRYAFVDSLLRVQEMSNLKEDVPDSGASKLVWVPYACLSLPMADLHNRRDFEGFGVEVGWGGGCKAIWSFSDVVACVGSVELSMHHSRPTIQTGNLKADSYLLVNPVLGVRLTQPISQGDNVFLELGGGALMQQNPDIRLGDSQGTILVEQGWTSTFAGVVRVGMVLSRDVEWTLSYADAGSPATPNAVAYWDYPGPSTPSVLRSRVIQREQSAVTLVFALGLRL